MAVIDFESRKRELEKKRGIKTVERIETPALDDDAWFKNDEADWLDDIDGTSEGFFLSSCPDKFSYVYELEMELVGSNLKKDELSATGKEALKNFGGVQESISRRVLVTGHTLLWQLHYIIQQAFGWTNSHLHRFSLPEESFKKITKDSPKTWGELCGIIFRFPFADKEDLYWYDHGYRRNRSLKSWFREKYTNEEEYGGEGEHYISNQQAVRDFLNNVQTLKFFDGKQVELAKASITDLRRGAGFDEDINSIVTRLPIGEVFTTGKLVPKYPAWRKGMKGLIKDILAMNGKDAAKKLAMFERYIDMGEKLMEKYCDEDGEFKDGVPYKLQEELREDLEKATEAVELRQMLLDAFNVMVDAFTDTLVYHYDYGDDWQVRITCKNVYYAAEVEEGEKPLFFNDEDMEVMPKLYDAVHKVSADKAPVCIACDGVKVLDNIGGLEGFCKFLQDYNSDDPVTLAEAKVWAEEDKWKEKVPNPKTLL